jgi:hypothetical protein
MADNEQLMASRIDGEVDEGPELVAKWADLEAAIRRFFTIPADTAMSEAMQVGTGPNITMTGTLTLKGNPTTDLMAAPKQYLQAQGSGMGLIRARAYRTTDLYPVDINQNKWIPMEAADVNDGTMWDVANPTRLTIPVGEGGHYLVGATASFDVPSVETKGWIRIYKNRSEAFEIHYEEQSKTVEIGASGLFFAADCVAGDYFELNVTPRTYTDSYVYAANTTIWAFKVW